VLQDLFSYNKVVSVHCEVFDTMIGQLTKIKRMHKFYNRKFV